MIDLQDSDRTTWKEKIYDDPDTMQNKHDSTTEGFNKYCDILRKKYKSYELDVHGSKRDSTFSLRISPKLLSSVVSILINNEVIDLRHFNFPYQIDDCLKIIKIADSYTSRYFNEEHYHLDWRDEHVVVRWANPNYKKKGYDFEEFRRRSKEDTSEKRKQLINKLNRTGISEDSINHMIVIQIFDDISNISFS